MTEYDAENLFKIIENIIFEENHSNLFASYIAVVKRNNNLEIKNDYYLEIGLEGRIIEIDNHNLKFKNLILEQINKELICRVEYQPDDVDIVDSDLVTLQDDDCNVKYSPFKQKVEFPSGGHSIINNSFNKRINSGSLGAAFKLKNHKGIYFISNFHVLARMKSKRYETILHPSKADFNDLYEGTNYNPIGTLFWFNVDKDMDAAIAKANHEKSVIGGIRCDESIMLEGITNPFIGMDVKKCGRSSGLTKGIIRSINCTVRIVDSRISKKSKKGHLFKNQILTDCISTSGDSGSLLINKKNEAIGLLFAGNKKTVSFHNNLNTIFNKSIKYYNGTKMPELKFEKFV